MTPPTAGDKAPEQPTAAEARPRLRVVRGDPTPEEIAAMLVALSVRVPPTPPAPKPQRGGWSSYAHQVRWPLHWSGHGWRAQARPR
jgi:hypothetical protein